jgi:predicted amidohydrolase YtcJ
MDAERPWASSVALSGAHIVAAGDDLRAMLAPGGRLIDLGNRCVLPGLIDSHIHFTGFATGRRDLDLSGTASLGEFQARVAERVQACDSTQAWILGHGWDQEQWPRRCFPTAADLDTVVQHNPVLLRAKSGHALVTNSVGLRLAHITSETADPPGGRIGRDASGEPDGMLFEGSAMDLIASLVAPSPPAVVDAALREALPIAWQVGLTTIHDMDGMAAYSAYRRLQLAGSLGLRVVAYIPSAMLDDAADLVADTKVDRQWLRIGGIKVFADGALGARTAAMLAPYDGEPHNMGVLTIEEDALRAVAQRGRASGLPLAVHAIGDRANRMALDVLEGAGSPSGSFRPHRIEHAQVLHCDDIGRFATQGVVASMQPIHATQDAPMADRYWGDRCAHAYAWKSLLESGAVLAFGSDCPVEDISPLLGIHAAVTRRTVDGAPGPDGWYPEQRLKVVDAVRSYTRDAAYAGGVHDVVGSIAPGKLADLVVLDRDIFECPPMEIARTQVVATMVGGQTVYGTL